MRGFVLTALKNMQRKMRSLKGLTLMMSLRQKMSLKLMMSLGLHNRPMRDR